MDVVTGAFSYTGRAIAEELLRRGREVRTLTRQRPAGDPLEGRIGEAALQFEDPTALRRALSDVETLYNTYWVRHAHGSTTFDRAVANTRVLLARHCGLPLVAPRANADTLGRVYTSELARNFRGRQPL